MSVYSDLQSVAGGILKDFNQGNISYIKIVKGVGDIDEPLTVETPFNVNGVVHGVKFKYVQNGLAISTDMQATIAVDSRFVPAASDFLDVDGVRYKITKAIPKPAAGDVVVNVLILRK